MTTGRAIAVAAFVGGVVAGALMGEYSVIDRWKIESQVRSEQQLVDRLQREVDSLAAYADSIEGDSATIERRAREKYGLIRNGEILYRFDRATGGREPE